MCQLWVQSQYIGLIQCPDIWEISPQREQGRCCCVLSLRCHTGRGALLLDLAGRAPLLLCKMLWKYSGEATFLIAENCVTESVAVIAALFVTVVCSCPSSVLWRRYRRCSPSWCLSSQWIAFPWLWLYSNYLGTRKQTNRKGHVVWTLCYSGHVVWALCSSGLLFCFWRWGIQCK